MASNSRRKSTKLFAQRCQWHRCAYYSDDNDAAVQPTLSNIFGNDLKHCFHTEIWLGRTQYSGIIDTAVTYTAELMTPLWHTQRYHCYDKHSGVKDSAVQIWYRCDFGPHIRLALATFKENIYWKNIHRQIGPTFITFPQKMRG
jgi:hypothetical protein